MKNDGDLDVVATSKLRGRIAMCKELLDLAIPDPAIRDTDA